MNSVITLIFILASLFITGCQVKEASSDGGLISGHKPATNSFTVQTPTSKTYVEAETITFNVTYPFDIIADFTGGNPRLRITVGSTTRYATFDSHPEPRKLVFKYVVQAGDADTNGIDVNALELNGSTMQFDNKGVLTNCDVTTVTTKNFSGAKVDTIGPTISAFNLTNLPGLYNAGEKITFSMTFSEKVYVTGTPKFVMDLTTGGAVDVTYVTGSGSTLLSFSYTVTDTVADTDGFDSITSPLDVGAGAIEDAVGNSANLDFSGLTAAVITYSSAVRISGLLPYVVNVAVPAAGTYSANDNLDFVLEFDRAVTVSGVPYIDVVIGTNTRQAQYVSGSGSEFLTFRYTAIPGDVDSDGISVTALIEQNAGDIVDTATPTSSFFGDPANNVLTVPSTTGVIIEAIQPQAISVARNTDTTNAVWGTAIDNKWIIGQELNVTVTFNTGMYVNQTSGTPSISLIIGAATREALYVSGGNGQTSLLFRYTIAEGDLDSDGTISLGLINLNGGVLTDAENTNSLLTLPAGITNTTVDGVRPTILTVTAPATGVYSTVAPLNQDAMDFTVTWSEEVNYSGTAVGEAVISLDVGGSTVDADFITGSNTNVMLHSPRSLAGTDCNTLNACTGVVVSSTFSGSAEVKDQGGNLANVLTFAAPDGTGILVDTTAPTVDSIVPVDLLAKTYVTGEFIDFTVDFSEPVTVLKNATHPRIRVNIGGATELLMPVSNGTNEIHTFRYTVVANDLDTDGIALIDNRVVSNGTVAYARDAGRNNVAGTFTIPSTTHLEVDAEAPTISGAPVVPADGSYVSGNTLSITVTYSEDVVVDTGGGTPYIAINFDEGTDNLPLTSTTANSLTFSITLDGTHFDMTGLPSSVTGITLNGATIEDLVGNTAQTVFSTALDLSNVHVTYSQVKLWVKNDFVNIAPGAAIAVVDNGAGITTEACGTGTCRTFDGDDELTLSADILNIDMVYMAIKTPDTVTGSDYDLMNTHIRLISDTGSNRYDYSTWLAQVVIDGNLSGSNTTHDTNTLPASGSVLYVDFFAGRTLSGTLINSAYPGAIGEVIATDNGLSGAQKTKIRNYIENKY